MSESFTPERAAAFRATIIGQIAERSHRKRVLMATNLVLVGVVAGAGVSTAAYAVTGGNALFSTPAQPSGQPAPDLGDAVVAPPGVQPGAPIISLLGATIARNVTGDVELPITDRPGGATHLRVTLTALTPGSVSWGTDSSGNNPSASAGQSEIDGGRATTWYDFPLDSTTGTLFVSPSGGYSGTLTLQFVTYVPTNLATNAQGITYGVEGGPDGAPDLVFVAGVGPGGQLVEGYAYAVALAVSSPDHPGMPTSPEEALEWQNETAEKYPNGWDVPVYESDGITQIGTFHMGR